VAFAGRQNRLGKNCRAWADFAGQAANNSTFSKTGSIRAAQKVPRGTAAPKNAPRGIAAPKKPRAA
jgi:hypothetical protein